MKIMFLTILLIVLSIVFFGCASAPAGNAQSVEEIALAVNAGSNESILVFQRKKTFVGSAVPMRIWMNDIELASGIRNGEEIQIVIPNGEHTIQAGSSSVDKGNKIIVFAENEMILFYAEPAMGAFAARFNLTQLGKKKL